PPPLGRHALSSVPWPVYQIRRRVGASSCALARSTRRKGAEAATEPSPSAVKKPRRERLLRLLIVSSARDAPHPKGLAARDGDHQLPQVSIRQHQLPPELLELTRVLLPLLTRQAESHPLPHHAPLHLPALGQPLRQLDGSFDRPVDVLGRQQLAARIDRQSLVVGAITSDRVVVLE